MKRAMLLLAIASLAATTTNTTERQRAEHALNRLAFGARPGEIDRVAELGVDTWIDRQLHPERINDAAIEARLKSMPTLSMSSADIVKKFYAPIVEARREAQKDGKDQEELRRELRERTPYAERPQRVVEELATQRILRAAESERQLNEVMVDFWMNHFNVFAGKGVDRFLLTGYERDTIRPRIWGKFEDLLMATAKSPAMLFYLDNARSFDGRLNENYAREIMELHTLGVDGGYTQKDVTELARVLTGWTIERPREGGTEFRFRPFFHDRGAKTVLGVKLAAGGGLDEGERMIRFLARQPATAHHIAFKLCQRLVADEPPPALVERVAKTFTTTGGDLRATVKAVIDSKEFWSAKPEKVKSPFEYVISAVRAAGAKVDNALPIARALQQIGEPLYGSQPPTGYSDKSEAWVNSGAILNRINFAIALTHNQLPGILVTSDDADALAKRIGSPEFQKQ